MSELSKVAVISGAGTGIGAATAVEFSEHGYHVVLLGRRPQPLETVKAGLKSAEVIVCDITNEKDLKKVRSKMSELPVKDLVLINNAAIFRKHAFQEDHLGHWKEQFETNVFGAVRLTQVLLPIMVQNKRGSIVNVSSTLALRSIPQTSAYSASKAAMNSWTQSLALEVAPMQIRVNCVCPGLVDTPIHDFHTAANKEALLKQMGPQQPLGRVGQPKDIAQSIYFLASNQSPWTTGAILSVDGGINLT